ncbi:MAG: ABC transporter permease [Clostridia bacterium]|nr:ABC transporter permease [Clostridia bacterium]
MKLWYSFLKELKLSSKSFYFYIEIGMALFLLALLLLVIPNEFNTKTTQYLFLDLDESLSTQMIESYKSADLDGNIEDVNVKANGVKHDTKLYVTETEKVYIVSSKEALLDISKSEKKLGVIVTLKDNLLKYDYYLQGYETEKYENFFKILHNNSGQIDKSTLETQRVMKLSEDLNILSDRENVIPSLLTFNGSLMGLFIIAAYVFLDKKEGIVTAYAVTASKVWVYLMSKVGVLMLTSVFTSLLLIIPVMGFGPNYALILIFLLASGFFSSALGLVVTSFYENIMQAFGVIYLIMVAMLLPNIAYFIPSWSPLWIKFIPSYYFLYAFKEGLVSHGNTGFVLMSAGGLLLLGCVLFVFANYRFKKTLTVSA